MPWSHHVARSAIGFRARVGYARSQVRTEGYRRQLRSTLYARTSDPAVPDRQRRAERQGVGPKGDEDHATLGIGGKSNRARIEPIPKPARARGEHQMERGRGNAQQQQHEPHEGA